MLKTSTLEILNKPHENGIAIFILGILFVLSIYHLLLYFQNKDKVYFYYSLYTFLLFINQLNDAYFSFISILIAPYINIFDYFNLPAMWLYNAIYFIFATTFLNLKKYSEKWNYFILNVIKTLLIIIFSTTLLAIITSDKSYIHTVSDYIIPFFFLFGLVTYYPVFKLKIPLKGYLIIGSLVLYLSSLLAFYFNDFVFIPRDNRFGLSIFYVGIVIENILFSLGLGQKQKLILKEKNESQKALIKKLQENEKLRKTVQQQLKKEVIMLNQQMEIDKHEKIKVKYDRELAELKVISLRSQMNPHFIFNSLNSIKLYIIDNKKENAVYYLNKFSKLIRKILAASREKKTTLSEEIETLKLYIDIENIRFNNEIKSVFTVDEKLSIDTIKIPSLISQPFVENAIWHGLSLKKESKKISINIREKGATHIEFTIEDNGIGRGKSALIKQKKMYKKDSVGINLTKERLTNFEKDYIHNYSLKFKDLYNKNNEASGTKVILRIPIL